MLFECLHQYPLCHLQTLIEIDQLRVAGTFAAAAVRGGFGGEFVGRNGAEGAVEVVDAFD